jgi:hypothetical protein
MGRNFFVSLGLVQLHIIGQVISSLAFLRMESTSGYIYPCDGCLYNPFATGPFLTRVLKPKSSIFKVFFNELLLPNLMKESETVCFIKLTTNCTLSSHNKFQPQNMLIKSHDLTTKAKVGQKLFECSHNII